MSEPRLEGASLTDVGASGRIVAGECAGRMEEVTKVAQKGPSLTILSWEEGDLLWELRAGCTQTCIELRSNAKPN